MVFGAIGGSVIGLISGYFAGQVDELLMRVVDLSLAIPFILVALTVLIVLGQSLTVIILLLIMFSWGGFARQVRAETLSLRTLDYIALAKVAGAGPLLILSKHILPGVINTIIVVSTLQVGSLILTESTPEFPRCRHSGAHTGLGSHGCRRASLPRHGMVARPVPGVGDLPDGTGVQLPGRLAQRPV